MSANIANIHLINPSLIYLSSTPVGESSLHLQVCSQAAAIWRRPATNYCCRSSGWSFMQFRYRAWLGQFCTPLVDVSEKSIYLLAICIFCCCCFVSQLVHTMTPVQLSTAWRSEIPLSLVLCSRKINKHGTVWCCMHVECNFFCLSTILS